MMKKFLWALVAGGLLSSCSTVSVTKSQRYPQVYAERPVSILVMPPINRSTKVDAKALFYSSLIVPLSQRGYYVFPPLLTMEILKEESAYDAEMFEESSMQPVGRLFGVDAVLFTTIHEWTKTTIAAQVQVTVEYTLRSAKTDAILFHRKGTVIYNPNTSSGSVLLNMLGDMLSAALTKEIELGHQCNEEAIGDMPAGGYSPVFGQDGNENAGSEEFSASFFR